MKTYTGFAVLLRWFLPLFVVGAAPAVLASDVHKTGDLGQYLASLGYASVPFKKTDRDQPLIEVELAGRRHIFLADTGCSMTTLQPVAAAGLKTLGQLGVTLEDSFLGTITNSNVALMSNLQVGPAQLFNQPAQVEKLDMDFVRLAHDGILGLDFFFRNFCLIDCHGRKLYLRAKQPSEQLSSAFQESLHRSGFIDVPLQGMGLIAIESKINGENVRLLVDTGDSISVLDQQLAARLHLRSVKSDEPANGSLSRPEVKGNLVGFNQIGTHDTRIALLDSFQIGEKEWKNLSYGVTNLKAWKLLDEADPKKGLQGIFGQELLAANGALIDFANRKLWLPLGKHPAK